MAWDPGEIERSIPMLKVPRPEDIRRKAPPGTAGVLAGEPDLYHRNVLAYAYITVPVPPILRRPLHGTRAQIGALRQYEARLAEILDDAGIE